MSDIVYKPTIIPLGPIKITRDQDYLRFLLAVLLTIATTAVLIWAYNEGILLQTYARIGPWFALGFSTLFVAGFMYGLTEMWTVSRGLNGLKRDNLDAVELKRMFGVSDFTSRDVGILKEEIADELMLRMEKVRNPATLAVKLGLFGTVYGIIVALSVLGGVASTEEVMAKLPNITDNLAMAFITTLVGYAINVVLMQMHRLLQGAAVRLKHRIFRTLHEESRRSGGGATS